MRARSFFLMLLVITLCHFTLGQVHRRETTDSLKEGKASTDHSLPSVDLSRMIQVQNSSILHSKVWTAQWITAPYVSAQEEAVLHFRKTLDIPHDVQHFIVHVSADNQFILYVNGQRTGTGPSRGDLAHWRFETYDIAPLLHPGKNLLAATVWSFGRNAPLAQMTDRVGFLLSGDGDTERLADTNASWEVAVDSSRTSLRPQVRGYYAAEPGERLDAAKSDMSWNTDSSVNGGLWTNAASLGRGALRGESDPQNKWQLVADPLPAMEMKLVSSGAVARVSGIAIPSVFPEQGVTIPAHTKASILLDNSKLITGYPALAVSGGLGATVRLIYAEALVDSTGKKGNRNQIEGKHIEGLVDEFLPSGSRSEEFVPLGWRTWRYLQVEAETADAPLNLDKLQTWFTAYPFVERGYFRSDDLSLDPIWQIGWRTARLNAHDTYMDTPYWERLQYVGDTRIQALISYAVAGDDRLARQAIQAFNDSRNAVGLTQSRYPSSRVQMIPTFSLLWVGMVHDFWIYRGDPAFVRAQLPGMRTVLDWYLHRQRPDGLLDKIPWWPFVDWGKGFQRGVPPQDENGGSAVITLQFVEALRYAAEMENAYGNSRLADSYHSAAEHAVKAVRELCWNDRFGLLADTPAKQHYSQHANILAVWLDVVPARQQKDLLTRILSVSDSSFSASEPVPPMTRATYYFRYYLARALEHAGMGDKYLDLLGPWREMVAAGLTTWGEGKARSDSHAWSAHPNYDLLRIVAGIYPQTPGFENVAIEPHLGALKHVQAALPVPRGLVEVEYKRNSNGTEATITLPQGVSGNLVWNGRKLLLHPGEQKLRLP